MTSAYAQSATNKSVNTKNKRKFWKLCLNSLYGSHLSSTQSKPPIELRPHMKTIQFYIDKYNEQQRIIDKNKYKHKAPPDNLTKMEVYMRKMIF